MLQQMQRQMQEQQQQHQQQSEEKKVQNRAQAKEQANPLPSGRDGLKSLRALAECPIPDEAANVKNLLDKMLKLELDNVDEQMQIVGEGIASVIMADTYCAKYKTKRPVVRFEDDEEIQEHHKNFHELGEKLQALQMELTEVAQAVQEAKKGRWETSVKKFGLAPEKFTYELDEEEGVIYLVDLKCNECSGRTRVRKARQEVADRLVEFERDAKKEKNDDRTGEGDAASTAPEGHAEERGEVSGSKQEVPGVADQPDTPSDDGDNGAAETD